MNLDTWAGERLILNHVATLQELETWYSINDVADRNLSMDALEEAKAEAEKGARHK